MRPVSFPVMSVVLAACPSLPDFGCSHIYFPAQSQPETQRLPLATFPSRVLSPLPLVLWDMRTCACDGIGGDPSDPVMASVRRRSQHVHDLETPGHVKWKDIHSGRADWRVSVL